MLPYKINTDLDPANVQENSSRLNVNVNLDILKAAITNEQGFDIVPLTSDERDIIGNCILPDNSLCLFSVINNNSEYSSEIGVLKDNRYSVVIRDNTSVGANFNFSTENLIQAESKVNFNGDFIVYFVDGSNSDKWLNLFNLQVDVTTDLKISSTSEMNLMLGFLPTISELPALSIIESGSLISGMYYVTAVYGDEFGNFTKPLLISNPIPVVESFTPFNNQSIGCAPNTLTNKAISLTIENTLLNTEYSFIKVYVISKINQVIKGYEFGTFNIGASDFTCIIDTLVNKAEVSVDSIIINNSDYKSSLTLTQLDDVLYKAVLKSRETIDLQPYVNNIKINYVQKPIDLSSVASGNSFRDPDMTFYSKGFFYDEVYAIYASFTIEDDGEYETQAYLIPGRAPVNIDLGGSLSNPPENGLLTSYTDSDYMSIQYYVDATVSDFTPVSEILKIDSTNSKIFHAVPTNDNPLASTNMGYWENKDERFSNELKWLTLDADGIPIVGKDLRGLNVRHHKFPEAYNHNSDTIAPDLAKSIHYDNTNYNKVNLLGIQLSDVVIPTELQGKVKRINIYYAKRDLNNRTIIGQSLLQSLSQIHNENNSAFGTNSLVFNNGGQLVGYEMLQGASNNAGIFPVGYERTSTQNGSQWMYSDNSFVEPTFWTKGFYKFKPFDMMNQSLNPSISTYVKNLYRVKSLYKAVILAGDLANSNSNRYTSVLFDPTNSTDTTSYRANYFGGIDRLVNNNESMKNYIRRITNASFVAQNFPNQREPSSTNPYSFSGQPYNYQGETSIWLETDYYLYNWKNSATLNEAGNDFPYLKYNDNSSFQTDNTNGLFCSPYISNLCAFKLNLFSTFDNQILCLAGSLLIEEVTTEIYGGDTFTSVYAEKGSIDLATWTPQGNPVQSVDNRPQNRINGLHCYIAQSTSNTNYRYKGDDSWEIFYPTASWEEMNTLIPNNPEWFGYNIDYSSVNDIKQPVIGSNFSNQFQTSFPNRVIRSSEDNPELQNDNYLIYSAGDYKDFGKIKGQIRNITNQNNKLLIKTDNALFATLGREIITTNNAEANVTPGDIFAVKPREAVSSDSYGGGLGRFADIVTQYGYFYPDSTNGIVYAYDGNTLDEISKFGKQIFFRNELKFKLPKKLDKAVFNGFPVYNPATSYTYTNYYVTFNNSVWSSQNTGLLGTPGVSTDWKFVDYNFKNIDSVIDSQSIGIIAAFDYKYRRYIISKKDYDFVDTFPNSYIGNLPDIFGENGEIVWNNGIFYKIYGVVNPEDAPDNSVFLGIRPFGIIDLYVYGVKADFVEDLLFTENRFTMAYYPEKQSWGSYYTYYPDTLVHSINEVYSFKKDYNNLYQHNSNLQNSLYYNREVPYASFVEPILNEPKGVSRTSSVNVKINLYKINKVLDYLKMFTSYFVRNSYQISDEKQIVNTKTSRNNEGYFNINDFRDMTRNNADPLMTNDIINTLEESNINPSKHWSKQKKFVDYYFIPRLIYNPQFELIDLELTHDLDSKEVFTAASLEEGDIIKFTVDSIVYVYLITSTTNYTYEVLSQTEATQEFTVESFYKLPTREFNLLDVNNYSHKNTR